MLKEDETLTKRPFIKVMDFTRLNVKDKTFHQNIPTPDKRR